MTDTRINPADIPAEMERELRNRFEADPKVRALRMEEFRMRQSGNFVGALVQARKIEAIYCQVAAQYIIKTKKDVKQVSLNLANLPDADVHYVLANIMTAFIAIDILDTCIMESNDCLHKTDKELQLDMFDELRHTAKLAKDKLAFLNETTTYLEHSHWGDIVDNMYDMMLNKAKSIMRKTEEKDKENIVKPKKKE